MKSKHVLLTLLIVIATGLFGGCNKVRTLTITSTPPEAFVRVDNDNVGRTPARHTFNFRSAPLYVVTATKTGYMDEQIRLNYEHPSVKRGELNIVLQEDEAFRMTMESEATNRWVRVEINPQLTPAQTWQRIVDSVTTAYDSIEQMDQVAGYIRTTPKVRIFQMGARGSYRIRTHLVGSIATRDPLTYRFQVRSQIRPERASDHAWEDFDRIFSEDAQLVQELQMRLGI